MTLLLGIDEAGRGPVLGPLVLCGVWLRPGTEDALVQLGIRDSKAFGSGGAARARRRELAALIRQRCLRVTLRVAEAEEIDRWVSRGALNQLERELARAIIDSGPPAARIVADGRTLFGPLGARYGQLEAVDRADASCPAVAAASIVAKHERDARFEALVAPHADELGPIRGGGYANAGTEAFLRRYVARHGALPDGVRRSWDWAALDRLGFAPLRRQLTRERR